MIKQNIPDAMQERDQWIGWTEEERNGKLTKIPQAPWEHSGNVPANDPEYWTGFENVFKWVEKLPTLKPGFVFHADGPFVGIDLDDCFRMDEEENLVPTVAARDIVERVDSYTEYSPSGNGLHVICTGELDGALKNDGEGVEIYDRDRFFTVTGHRLTTAQNTVQSAQDALDFLQDEYLIDEDTPLDDVDTSFDGEAGDHELYNLSASDVYPTLPEGENIPHPIHGSSTGANFKIHESGPTAVCWRGRHQYGGKNCCVLCAWHLLAMENTVGLECDDARRDYPFGNGVGDDELVFNAWVEAYHRGLVDGTSPPWRAVNHIASKYLTDMSDGGKEAYHTFQSACSIIREQYDIPVEADKRDECAYAECDLPTKGPDTDYCSAEHKLFDHDK